jgi:hypothetical protein
MPNWVTNKVKAPSHVINAMVNDVGEIDFNRIIPFEGEWAFDGVFMDAEELAEIVTGQPLDSNPLIGVLQAANRERADIKKLSDTSFEQFVQMLRNFRKCGLLHQMDFARKEWGTKWNACDQTVDAEAGTAQFDTAWSCPEAVLKALSKKFPADVIEVVFADEDIGCNCGRFTLKGGEEITSDIAPRWNNQTAEQKAKWKAFAYEVKGWNPEDMEDEEE